MDPYFFGGGWVGGWVGEWVSGGSGEGDGSRRGHGKINIFFVLLTINQTTPQSQLVD